MEKKPTALHPSVEFPEEWEFHGQRIRTNRALIMVGIRLFFYVQNEQEDYTTFLYQYLEHYITDRATTRLDFMNDEGKKRAFFVFYKSFCEGTFVQSLIWYTWKKKVNPLQPTIVQNEIKHFFERVVKKQKEKGTLTNKYQGGPWKRKQEEELEKPCKKRKK
jgi:hypothetical protein